MHNVVVGRRCQSKEASTKLVEGSGTLARLRRGTGTSFIPDGGFVIQKKSQHHQDFSVHIVNLLLFFV